MTILFFIFGVLFYFMSKADADSQYLGERFSYYTLKLQNLSQHAGYSPDAYTSCDYIDVCEYDLDKIVWTVSTFDHLLIALAFLNCIF